MNVRSQRFGVLTAATLSSLLALSACSDAEDPSQAGSDGQSSVSADVQEAFDTFVTSEMPGVPLEVLNGAAEEGSVTAYSLNSLNPDVIEGFEEVFPFVEVDHIPLSGALLDSRVQTEREGGLNSQDVVFSSMPSVVGFNEKGWCAKYTPTSDSAYGSKYKVPGAVYAWNGTTISIAFSTGTLSDDDIESLSSWDTLMDERWSGKKFGWIEVAAGFSSLLPNYYLYKTYGDDLWKQNAELGGSPALFSGTDDVTAALVSGQIDLSGPLSTTGPFRTWETGAPIGWITPEPTLATINAVCIGADSPHPNAAKLFEEFVLSAKGQELLTTGGNVVFRTGANPTARYPQDLLNEPWYSPVELSNVYEYEPSDVTDPAMISAWRMVFGG